MVDALNRLDQTDANVEQLLGDRANVEHIASRRHTQSNFHAQAYPMEAETTTRSEPDSYSVHGAESDTENEQLEWDPETIDDDGYPLVDEKTGPPWYLFHVTDLWTRLKQVR